MNEFSKSLVIDAPLEHIWAVLSDLEHWHQWTSSVTSIKLTDGGPLRVGSRMLIRQPRLPRATWTITSLKPGRSFTSTRSGPGFTMVARHKLESVSGGTQVTFILTFSGLFGGLLARMTATRNERNLGVAAEGLRNRCESPRTELQ